MKEACIILPVLDNDGEPVPNAHGALRIRLLEYFGGFTANTAQGAWRDPAGRIITENVIRYEVAMDENPQNANVMVGLAAEAAAEARQHSVYLRQAGGAVLFVEPVVAADVTTALAHPAHLRLVQ